jgi:beta-glucanase (GH16 family)
MTQKVVSQSIYKYVYNYCPPGNTWKTFPYQAPGFFTSRNMFKYGYLEARIRVPQLNGSYNNYGIGANFWLSDLADDYPNDYSEIDVVEFIGGQTGKHNYSANIHYGPDISSKVTDPSPIYTDYPNDGGWHTFGVSWTADRLDFYLDDVLYHSSTHHPSDLSPLSIILDINVLLHWEADDRNSYSLPTQSIDYEYDIDYAKVYHMDQTKSNTNFTNCNLSNLDNSLYRTIVLGGSGCSAIVGSNDKVFLRAREYIILDKGFTVYNGGSFSSDIISAFNQQIINR